ncbi:MAG: hypothetical protein MUQ76_04630, partial [Reinekea forsetii]|nr:hypothetical protein [Reinekea forsetii]
DDTVTSHVNLAEPLEQEIHMNSAKYEVVRNGISFGSALAIAISWTAHKSIIWAIIHGFLGWFYVVFYALFR